MTEQKVIWILEDDEGSQFVYENIFSLRYQIEFHRSKLEFLNCLHDSTKRSPALLLADLRLHDGNFIDVLRSEQNLALMTFPFLVVSSVDDVDALRFCFKQGAYDYLIKPFQKSELIVKVERAIEANSQEPQSELKIPEELDSSLTLKQQKILSPFLKAPQKTVSRTEIMALVWGKIHVAPKTIDVHIHNLRKKLNSAGYEIQHTGQNSWALQRLELSNRMDAPINRSHTPLRSE